MHQGGSLENRLESLDVSSRKEYSNGFQQIKRGRYSDNNNNRSVGVMHIPCSNLREGLSLSLVLQAS